MENYADVLESYVIVEEGFGETLGKAKEAILRGINKLIEKIRELIAKIRARLSRSSQNTNKNVASAHIRFYSNILRDIGKLARQVRPENPDTDNFNSSIEEITNKISEYERRFAVFPMFSPQVTADIKSITDYVERQFERYSTGNDEAKKRAQPVLSQYAKIMSIVYQIGAHF